MKALYGATGEEPEPPPAQTFLVILEHVPKDIASQLLFVCGKVLAEHGYHDILHRTDSGGYLLAGRKREGR